MSINDPRIKEALEKKLGMQIGIKNPILEVGFLEDAKYENGMPVAQVAYQNEFGTHKIPPRPFFRTAIKKNANKWLSFFHNRAKENDPLVVLGMLGEAIRGDIMQSINQTNTPANAESTIRAKKSSKPLVDTGFMRASVDFRLRSKK